MQLYREVRFDYDADIDACKIIPPFDGPTRIIDCDTGLATKRFKIADLSLDPNPRWEAERRHARATDSR